MGFLNDNYYQNKACDIIDGVLKNGEDNGL